jgi:hypothetical protein
MLSDVALVVDYRCWLPLTKAIGANTIFVHHPATGNLFSVQTHRQVSLSPMITYDSF